MILDIVVIVIYNVYNNMIIVISFSDIISCGILYFIHFKLLFTDFSFLPNVTTFLFRIFHF